MELLTASLLSKEKELLDRYHDKLEQKELQGNNAESQTLLKRKYSSDEEDEEEKVPNRNLLADD